MLSTFFSAASTTPSFDRMPTVEPAWLIASMAYSTWRHAAAQGGVSAARRRDGASVRAWYSRPSGLKMVVRLS